MMSLRKVKKSLGGRFGSRLSHRVMAGQRASDAGSSAVGKFMRDVHFESLDIHGSIMRGTVLEKRSNPIDNKGQTRHRWTSCSDTIGDRIDDTSSGWLGAFGKSAKYIDKRDSRGKVFREK